MKPNIPCKHKKRGTTCPAIENCISEQDLLDCHGIEIAGGSIRLHPDFYPQVWEKMQPTLKWLYEEAWKYSRHARK